MTIKCFAPDSALSIDEGIETALSCFDSHEAPLMSGFVRQAADQEDGSGYDVPVQASRRSKTRPAGGESAGGQEETLLMRQSGDEVTALHWNSSPPPTYSQLFRNSTTSTASSTCDPVKAICTHNQLHVAKAHERSGDRDEEEEEGEGGCLSLLCVNPSSFFRPPDTHSAPNL